MGGQGFAWELGSKSFVAPWGSIKPRLEKEKNKRGSSKFSSSFWVCICGGVWELPSGIAYAVPFQSCYELLEVSSARLQ